MFDAFDQLLQFFALRFRQQRHARAFNGCIADLDDFRVGKIRNQPDAAGGVDFQMATEAAGQVENVDVVE